MFKVLSMNPQHTVPPKLGNVLRENFGEVGRRGHHETFVVARPRYQVLYTVILQHARNLSADGESLLLTVTEDLLVELVYESCLDHFRLL